GPRRWLIMSLALRPPPSPLFPYTTLFRSAGVRPGMKKRNLSFSLQLRTLDAEPERNAPRLSPAAEENEAADVLLAEPAESDPNLDRKSTRLNSSHLGISYAVFRLKKKTAT